MKHTILTTAFYSLLAMTGMAQTTTGIISGGVGDPAKKPIEAATISLLRAKDSTLVRSTVTDRAGHYSLDKVAFGKYLVSASSVGHLTVYTPAFELSAARPQVRTEALVLNTVSKNLQEVAVVGKRPFLEQKADRMVVNVDASPSNAGSTAMDVLERSPGITIDKDDNISLKGKQGVTVMIDNKPTYLSASQLASYLKSLPASSLDQIEIMSNPSAKYDASGNSGIINIKTKKNKMKGFNGSVTLSHVQGVYGKPSGSVNVNYRDGKANYFLNASAARWENYQLLDIGRTYLDPGPGRVINSIFTQRTNMHRINNDYNVKFGMDYYLTSRTTVGFVASGFIDKEKVMSGSNIFLKDSHNTIDSIVYSPSTNRTKWKNGSVNLNFRHQFDSAGTELTADLDYVRYASASNQYFDNITYFPDMTEKGRTTLRGDLPSNINIYTLKSDYTNPLSKVLKLEAGMKSSYVNTDNAANYFNIVNGVTTVDTKKTNHFRYKENINAAYINLNRQFKKWTVQAGLRFENTNYSGHQFGNGMSTMNKDSSFSRSYGSLFPTFFVSYQASDKNQFTVNYGRRIDRPAYQDLNPFLFFLDQYTYEAGNPYLQPQFSHNIELSHTYARRLTTTLNYSRTTNFFSETFEQSGRATILRNGNIGHRENAGISVSLQQPILKWWTAILYSNLNYNKFTGVLYGESINVDATTLLLNLNNQFDFGHGWSGEISGFYRTKGVEGQIVIRSMGQANAALSKKLFKEKGTVKVGIRDIFYTMQNNGYINFQQTEATFHNSRDSRQVSASFTYRFGKPLKGGGGRRQHSGASDEQNRVKAGGNSN